MFYTEKENLPGTILLLDFATAFDSISWDFMFTALRYFNFGEDLIKWVKLFYKNIESCVVINGHLSEWFSVQCGCRQGDPLSPYLFMICAEICALMLKHNPNITGIKCNNSEFLLTQYADNTSVLLDGSEKSLK